MFSITSCDVPSDVLLSKYRNLTGPDGAYADCYQTSVSRSVSLADFVFAFYSSPAFRPERVLLGLAVSKPSTDEDARQLANADVDRFSAWSVEDRTDTELLLCDYMGRTRSWLRVVPTGTQTAPRTTLQFGSAVVPRKDPTTGEATVSIVFRALTGFHDLYSRVLLQGAKARLENP